MAMFPEVQKKAQEELDRVIGPGRLPDYGDINSLPYVRVISYNNCSLILTGDEFQIYSRHG